MPRRTSADRGDGVDRIDLEARVPERVRSVLDYITTRYIVHEDLRNIDFEAAAAESGQAIESDKREAIKREKARADELAGPFQDGLVRAYRARLAGLREIALDDRDPAENAIADALIHALVRTDLAASTSEETVPYHYVYRIAVDWPRLDNVAGAAGVDLDAALTHLVSDHP
jgi:hypothetical protein